MELLPEEAYYWTYAQHPSLSYFDHPPMVAWIIWLGTNLFGDSEFGVRFGTLLLALGSTVLIYRLGQVWFNHQVGLAAALLFTIVPVFVGTGMLAFPDGPLIFFWLLTLVAVTQAIHPQAVRTYLLAGGASERRRQALYWGLAGVAYGAALLSKYTAILLGPSLLLFLVGSRDYRPWLRRPGPWLAAVIALAVFSPVIIWNAQHDWASFRFQTSRTDGSGEGWAMNVAQFWLSQVAILTPILFGACVLAAGAAVKHWWRDRDDRWGFVAAFFFPMFLVFVHASFKTEVHINWTAPAYLTLLVAVAALFVQGVTAAQPARVRRWRWGGIVTGCLCVLIMALGLTTLVWGVPSALAYRHVGGWRQLAREVDEIEDALERETGQRILTIGVDKYNLAAQLGYYMAEPHDTVNAFIFGKTGLGYPYWSKLQRFEGQPVVMVFKRMNDDAHAILSNYFSHATEPRRIEVATTKNRSRVVYVVTGYGFRLPAQQQVRGDANTVEDDDRP
jgi:dolichol-phosphate mannosyltransferase